MVYELSAIASFGLSISKKEDNDRRQKNINDSEIFIKKNAYGDVANINAENTTS